ncbi:hypothetical protein LWI29_037056 [Acer saccharum]|uniref:NAC domain-containing protein n=1 Tax=Acer saccharum TaxID=4024 RepID=A0AA39S9E5_ACESA|nr:hypothetical protein LWI29_037056 [Acer saccharum]
MQADAPLGFRFMPSDEELVERLFLRKIRAQTAVEWNPILHLYGYNRRGEIFHGTDHELSEEDCKFYVFTR